MQLIAVLENPNYIINIGNAIRNANGLGVDKLFVIDGLKRLDDDLDALRRRKSLVKHSSGAIQFTDVMRFDTSEQCFNWLSRNEFASVATSPGAAHKRHFALHEADLTAPKLAIWFGDEGNGLSNEAVDRCDFGVSIEMFGNVESFNLGTSTGIVLYEAVRQRRKKKP